MRFSHFCVRKAFCVLQGVVENVSFSLDLGEFPNFFIDSYTFSKIKPVLTYVAEGSRVPFQPFCAEQQKYGAERPKFCALGAYLCAETSQTVRFSRFCVRKAFYVLIDRVVENESLTLDLLVDFQPFFIDSYTI